MPDAERSEFEYDEAIRETYVRHLRWLVDEILPAEPDWEPVFIIDGRFFKASWKSVAAEDGRLVFEGFWMEPLHG